MGETRDSVSYHRNSNRRHAGLKSAKSGRQGGGGPAATGGYNFQAAVTGIAMVHALSGSALGWLDGLILDAPIEVAVETGSGGDDLRLTFASGEIAEAQVKKGLRSGKELRETLAALSRALQTGETSYGILIVDPNTSRTISQGLAADIIRLAEDSAANVGSLANDLRRALIGAGMGVQAICAALRVITIPALESGDAAVRTALAYLGRVCASPENAQAGWDRLYRDAHLMMARRGRRTRSAIAAVLRSAGIALSSDPTHGPSAILARICDWTLSTTSDYSIVGVPRPLSVDDAWLPLTAVVRDQIDTPATPDLAAALAQYHGTVSTRRDDEAKGCDADTLGRLQRLAVVVSGPGSGKTTLLKRLARAYARDGHPVLRVSALAVARRMASLGEGFAAAAFTLGLEGTGLSPQTLSAANLGDWVLLCDGLDECGALQDTVADGLLQFVAGQPNARIIATARSIGYRPAKLAAWRHYDLPFFGGDSAVQRMTNLLHHILPEQARPQLYRRVEEALEDSDSAQTAARSPLLLSLCAALFASGTPLGRTRVQFYRSVFETLEAEPPPRADQPPATSVVRGRFLDVLGWTLLNNPEVRSNAAIDMCASILRAELDISSLKSRDLAECCLAYWQALGVLERVHYAGDQTLTFIHKTFGEFTAGRYLAALPLVQQAEILKAHTDVSAISEAITFASGLGAAPIFLDDLLSRGLEGVKGQGRLLQALEVLAEAEPPMDSQRTERVVAEAIDKITGTHRTWAFETGEAMMRVARCSPNLIATSVRPLCNHDQTWTRLCAWAIRAATAADHLDLDSLLDVMDSFTDMKSEDIRANLGGETLRGKRGRSLMQEFAFAIAERIVIERPKTDAEQKLERFLPLIETGTYGFYMRLLKLAAKYEIRLPDPHSNRNSIGRTPYRILNRNNASSSPLSSRLFRAISTLSSLTTQTADRSTSWQVSLSLSAFVRRRCLTSGLGLHPLTQMESLRSIVLSLSSLTSLKTP